ncbi:hypothetical protein J23TS9_13040 [Paenibacillus sp. J23TS9]|uniref:stalk domain-containing protein n=1 Tax=Paenibacillus sp. J23TS9 TaxID=2807193 RepID=UPI001B20A6A8|nr:stalk domain-containing protein [Paenibacillus sp. J23TS9]GIP26174.1 hypothetical protein J23TS9_13040 [Paenibacillus sp. J23TS9]
MKKKKLLVGFVGILILSCGISIGALASSSLQEIKAYLNGSLKIRVNGNIAQLKDGNGHQVLPITYNGVTFLPVRSVSDVLGIPVTYDNKANEVILGEQSGGTPVSKDTPIKSEDFDDALYSKDPTQTTINGKNYGEVLFSPPGENFNYVAFTPNGKYKKLYLQFAAVKEKILGLEIKELEKNALLKKVGEIKTEDGIQTIEVDITGVKTITIDVDKKQEAGYVIPLTTSYYK